MQLHEVMKEKFGNMPKDALRMVIVAMTPCKEGIEWFDANFNGDWAAVPMTYLSWFARPYLRGADLGSANLFGANLGGANLFGADLGGAYLGGANLFGANLGGADLFGANLFGANLGGVNLFGADLRGSHYNEFTRWPEGFSIEDHV